MKYSIIKLSKTKVCHNYTVYSFYEPFPGVRDELLRPMLQPQGVNPLLLSVPFLYPLKTSENLRFAVFRVYKMGKPGSNGLKSEDHKLKGEHV